MQRRVLVPPDGGQSAEMALTELAEVAHAGDEIMLLSGKKTGARRQVGMRASHHFSDPSAAARLAPGRDAPVFETKEEVRERQLATINRYLGSKADELQRQGFNVLVQPIVARRAAKAIIESAAIYRPSVILMVRRTLDPRRFIFGSVSSDVEKAAVAPVLLVRAGSRRPVRA